MSSDSISPDNSLMMSVRIEKYDPDTGRHLIILLPLALNGAIEHAQPAESTETDVTYPVRTIEDEEFASWVTINEPVQVGAVYYGNYTADFINQNDLFSPTEQVFDCYVSLFNMSTSRFLSNVSIEKEEMVTQESKDPNTSLKFCNGPTARQFRDMFDCLCFEQVKLEPCLVSETTEAYTVDFLD